MIHHACPNCDALQAEIDWLKAKIEGSSVHDGERVFAVQSLAKPRLTPASAQMILALYDAPNKLLTCQDLDGVVPSRDSDGGRSEAHIFSVYACRIRKALGSGAILNRYGYGYYLSPALRAQLDALFGVKAAA